MVLFLTYLYAFQLGGRPMTASSYAVAMGILASMLILMYQLQTEVSDTQVVVRFGLGLIKRSIPVDAIQSVEVVTNKWYYGWGIRWIPNGWLYNVRGTKGIEIKLKKGRVARIGSADPEGLARAVQAVISK
jgi:hypothetical protein